MEPAAAEGMSWAGIVMVVIAVIIIGGGGVWFWLKPRKLAQRPSDDPKNQPGPKPPRP